MNEWLVAFLLNISAVCFFSSEVFGIIRGYRAKNDMESTSMEGKVLHVIGNWIAFVIAILIGAWVAVFVELFLGCLCTYKCYLKTRWLLKTKQWSWGG